MVGMTETDLPAALRRARAAKAWTIRRLAAEADVATGTVQRYERDDPGVITPQTLKKIADALGLAVTQSPDGQWVVRPMSDENGQTDDTSGHSLMTDGSVLLTLRVPASFATKVPEESWADIEADTLLEVLRLAQEARRRASS